MATFNWKDSQGYEYDCTIASNGDIQANVEVGGIAYKIYYKDGIWTYESGANSILPNFISGTSAFNQEALDRWKLTTDFATLTGGLIQKGTEKLLESPSGASGDPLTGPKPLPTLTGGQITQTGNIYNLKSGNTRFVKLGDDVKAIGALPTPAKLDEAKWNLSTQGMAWAKAFNGTPDEGMKGTLKKSGKPDVTWTSYDGGKLFKFEDGSKTVYTDGTTYKVQSGDPPKLETMDQRQAKDFRRTYFNEAKEKYRAEDEGSKARQGAQAEADKISDKVEDLRAAILNGTGATTVEPVNGSKGLFQKFTPAAGEGSPFNIYTVNDPSGFPSATGTDYPDKTQFTSFEGRLLYKTPGEENNWKAVDAKDERAMQAALTNGEKELASNAKIAAISKALAANPTPPQTKAETTQGTLTDFQLGGGLGYQRLDASAGANLNPALPSGQSLFRFEDGSYRVGADLPTSTFVGDKTRTDQFDTVFGKAIADKAFNANVEKAFTDGGERIDTTSLTDMSRSLAGEFRASGDGKWFELTVSDRGKITALQNKTYVQDNTGTIYRKESGGYKRLDGADDKGESDAARLAILEARAKSEASKPPVTVTVGDDKISYRGWDNGKFASITTPDGQEYWKVDDKFYAKDGTEVKGSDKKQLLKDLKDYAASGLQASGRPEAAGVLTNKAGLDGGYYRGASEDSAPTITIGGLKGATFEGKNLAFGQSGQVTTYSPKEDGSIAVKVNGEDREPLKAESPQARFFSQTFKKMQADDVRAKYGDKIIAGGEFIHGPINSNAKPGTNHDGFIITRGKDGQLKMLVSLSKDAAGHVIPFMDKYKIKGLDGNQVRDGVYEVGLKIESGQLTLSSDAARFVSKDGIVSSTGINQKEQWVINREAGEAFTLLQQNRFTKGGDYKAMDFLQKGEVVDAKGTQKTWGQTAQVPAARLGM